MRRERTNALNEAMTALTADERYTIEVALEALESLAEELKERRP